MKMPTFQLNDKTVFWGGAVTMYAYPLIGWAILLLFAPNVKMIDLIDRGLPLIQQVVIGLLFGAAAYLVIHALIFSGWLSSLTYDIAKISEKLNWVQIVFLSLAAGFGEEILFRVSLQHFFGIWPTAIFFVAIHGYLSLSNYKIFIYGVFMTIVSAGFGFLNADKGIFTAITAHAVIDLFIFSVLKITGSERFKEVKES